MMATPSPTLLVFRSMRLALLLSLAALALGAAAAPIAVDDHNLKQLRAWVQRASRPEKL